MPHSIFLITTAYEKIDMSSLPQHTHWLPQQTPSPQTPAQMSVLFPPTFHVTSQPLDDEVVIRQAEEYLADERLAEEADQARLAEYLAAVSMPETEEPITAAAVDAALVQSMRLLAVVHEDDDEEELDTHSCADSDCQGEHTHSYDPDYECGHVSPATRVFDAYGCDISNPYSTPYYPATPEFD